ncbi:MAG: hypothetical protein COB78_08180 [Hyphomicrobiales bacterium]|nr:MAG: hypothetical protein COB78_08180 [Hyphomicrobiales bacterium]
MLQTIKLLLPALMPSWRFFSVIAPSPRIEITLLKTAKDTPDSWQEFRPRPAHLSIGSMLKRMFYNARWNEALFLTSLAERLSSNPTEHSSQEILKRIKAELVRNSFDSFDSAATPHLQFRLVFVHREGEQLQKHVTFISPVYGSFGDTDS